MYDFVEFDAAIGKGLSLVNLEETLVMVSADHSHTFSMGAYGLRGESIFGIGTPNEKSDDQNDNEPPLISN